MKKCNFQKFIIFTLICMSMNTLLSQELNDHKWNDRLLLIITNNVKNSTYKAQIKELNKHQKGLIERKLVIYHILPTKFKKGLKGDNWTNSRKLYKSFKTNTSECQILLIGLDGNTKLTTSQFLSCDKLFSTIDMMPMRQSELKKN